MPAPGANRVAARVASATVVLVVVAFDPAGFLIFAPVKWALLTVGTAVLVVAVRVWSVHRISAVAWIAALLWGVVVSLSAVDPLYTWIGTPDRHLGLLAWLVFAVLFWAGQSITRTEGVGWLHRAAVVALGVAGVVALFEWMGRPLVDLATESTRLGGPFGSPAYLGAALTLLIPLAAVMAADPDQGSWRIAGGAAALLGVAVAIGTQTRAAWIGLAIGAAVTWPCWRRWAAGRLPLVLAGAAALAAVIALSPFGDRIASTFDAGVPARVDEWRVGLSALGDHAVLGTGFEGYRIVFPETVGRDYVRQFGRAVIPDRAHSGPLDVALTAGMVGGILMVGAVVWLVRLSWRAVREGSWASVGLAAAVTGYLAQQMFLFPLAEVDPVLWLAAGALVATQPDRIEFSQPPWLIGAGTVLVAVALWFGIREVAADRWSATALETANPAEALAAADRATELRPDSIRSWLVAASVAAASGETDDYRAGLVRVEEAAARSPRDPAVLASRASLAVGLATSTGAEPDLAAALRTVDELVTVDPFNARHHNLRGATLAQAGRGDDAEDAFLTAADLAPAWPNPYLGLGLLAQSRGDEEAAQAWFHRAEQLAEPPEEPEP